MQISKTTQEVQDYVNPQLVLAGYLFTVSDATVNTRTSIQVLRQTYTDRVLHTVIPHNTDLRDAHFNKQAWRGGFNWSVRRLAPCLTWDPREGSHRAW